MIRPIFLYAALLAFAFSAAPSMAQAVPAIGCPTDGQLGPEPAPKDGTKPLTLAPAAAAGLAFYRNAEIGVLGPRGWHC